MAGIGEVVAQVARGEEEIAFERKREQARKNGHRFFAVKYVGNAQSVPRIHSIEDVIPYEVPDYERPGETKLETRLGTSCLEFKKNSVSGDWVSEILDTEYNRHFVANQRDNGVVSVSDEFQERFIEPLIGKKFEVEVSEAETIRRDIRRLETKLADVEARPAPRPKFVAPEPVKPALMAADVKPGPVQPLVEKVAEQPEQVRRKRGRPAARMSAPPVEAKGATDGVNEPNPIVG